MGQASRNPSRSPELVIDRQAGLPVESGGTVHPVEVSRGGAPAAPYDSHIFQLGCLLPGGEKTTVSAPPTAHPLLRPDFAIDYTRELESALLRPAGRDPARRNPQRCTAFP